MSDLISRQAAIDMLMERASNLRGTVGDLGGACSGAAKLIAQLPSAQPEIIQCRNCKFASGDSRICMKFGHSPIGELDFCAWAELHAPYVNEEPPTDGCYGCKHRIIRSVPTSKFYCDLDDAFHDNLTNCPLEQDAPSASELRGEEYWADQGDEE